jgi:DNA-binding CsgD family transcriptional regulator
LESAVFALVVRGKLNKQIAHDLRTSERTVKAHRQSIMKKLNVRSVAEAVPITAKLGIHGAPVDGADAKMPGGHPPAEGVDCTKGQ